MWSYTAVQSITPPSPGCPLTTQITSSHLYTPGLRRCYINEHHVLNITLLLQHSTPPSPPVPVLCTGTGNWARVLRSSGKPVGSDWWLMSICNLDWYCIVIKAPVAAGDMQSAHTSPGGVIGTHTSCAPPVASTSAPSSLGTDSTVHPVHPWCHNHTCAAAFHSPKEVKVTH